MDPSKRMEIESLESLPLLAKTIRFYDWVFISEGTHSEIFRVRDVESDTLLCVKLFRKGWMTPFNLEKTAYEHLRGTKVHPHLPLVYGYGYRTLSNWGFPASSSDEEPYYALVMEWLEGAEQLSTENITLEHAYNLLEGLAKIHDAGVVHYDSYRRNMMVTPQRAVWIDFSCAHMGVEYAPHEFDEEMKIARAIIHELVSTKSVVLR
jgi:RIO-like serine/threonine protein kinase